MVFKKSCITYSKFIKFILWFLPISSIGKDGNITVTVKRFRNKIYITEIKDNAICK